MNKKINKESVILIYVRPWFSDFYKILALQLERNFSYKVVFFSDYEMEDVHNISPYKSNIKESSDVVKNEYFDIIKRDRLLRHEPWGLAVSVLEAYEANISSLFAGYDVKFLFSATVDQFAIDMCYRHCLKSKIPFIGYHLSVIPGYTLLTSRGESSRFRNPTEEEISVAIELITPKSFRPSYIPKKGRLRLAGFSRFCANLLRVPYFFYKDTCERKYNYHFKASLRFAWSHVNFSLLWSLFSSRLKLKNNERFDIYIPLQLHPECNSEYWGRGTEYQDYEDLIYSFCKRHSESFSICMKEHPNMVGLRGNTFYKKFEDLGVNVVDIEEDNRSLVERSTVVVTYNSSVGIEGLVYGASILCLGQPYYHTAGHISDEARMVSFLKNDISLTEQKNKNAYLIDAVRQTLSMSFAGWLPDTTKLKDQAYENEFELKAAAFASDLKKYFLNIVAENLNLEDVFTYKETKDD